MIPLWVMYSLYKEKEEIYWDECNGCYEHMMISLPNMGIDALVVVYAWENGVAR